MIRITRKVDGVRAVYYSSRALNVERLLTNLSSKCSILYPCRTNFRTYTSILVIVNYSTGGDLVHHEDTQTDVRWPELTLRFPHDQIDLTHQSIQTSVVVRHAKSGFMCRRIKLSKGSHGYITVRYSCIDGARSGRKEADQSRHPIWEGNGAEKD